MLEKSSASSLPWVWIIETLSNLKQVDASVLQDIIECAPAIPDDVGMNMREMVALRCLEELCSSADGISNDASGLDTKIDIDPSKSCEDVLKKILQKASSKSVLRTDGLDLLTFISHKKICMPKTALQQLKDTLLDDAHPYSASLKEISGLEFPEGSANFTVPDSGNKISEASDDRNLMPSKRSREESAVEHLAEYHENQNNINDFNELHANVKKVKHPETHCEAGDSVLPNGDILEDASVRVCQVTEREAICLAKDNTETPDGVDSGAKNKVCVVLQKSQQIVNKNAEFRHLRLEFPSDSNLMSQEGCSSGSPKNNYLSSDRDSDMHRLEQKEYSCAPLNGTCQRVSATNSQGNLELVLHVKTEKCESPGNLQQKISIDDVDYRSEEGVSSDSDGYHNVRINVSKKKHEFLSSQRTVGPNSLPTDECMEKNICMKCSKGGNLLVCSGHDCVVVLHENCLGFSATFDDQGNFYCPFCLCTRAIREYQRARREALLARKKLSAFICNGDVEVDKLPKKGNQSRSDEGTRARKA